MRTDQPDAEDLLRRTLQAKAVEAHGGLTLDDVRRHAAAARRRTLSLRAAGVAAVAAVVVGVPTAVVMQPDRDGPSPAPSPTQTGPVSPTPTGAAGLEGIRRGADPKVAYLFDQRVHEADGSTVSLPDPGGDVVQFTPYHGGWLTVSSTGTLTEWDSSGTAVLTRAGEAALAVSGDQLSAAYGVAGKIHVGIASGMGNGEVIYSVGSARLVGFAKDRVGYDDVVFSGGDGGQVGYIDRGMRHLVPGLSEADATTAGSDLVGGLAPDGVSGRVVTLDGEVLWTLPWQPRAFSPDGRYVVATLLSADSEPTDIGILDARTGSVLAKLSLADRGLRENTPLVWEETNGSALVGVEGAGKQAVLRLTPAGDVTRATDVVAAADASPWVFGTTP